MEVQSVFIKYIFAPLLLLISTIVLSFWNKKNALLNNKKLIISILLGGLVLALPGISGLLSFAYMPWGYIFGVFYALVIGVLWVYILHKIDPSTVENRKSFVFVITLVVTLLAIYLFRLVFDKFSDFPFGWWGATSVSVFVVPILFWWTYIALLSIPLEIHKVWEYPRNSSEINLDHLDFDKLLVLELELYKNKVDLEPLRVKVKAPANMNFGLWFQKFIDDYNIKFPNSGIHYQENDGDQQKWIFVVKRSLFQRNMYIDPELTVENNFINEKMTIHAKRVSETIG